MYKLEEPQIHIVGDKFVSRSLVNNIMQVSKEARNEVLKGQFQYFEIESIFESNYGCCLPTSRMKSYISRGSIIWLADKELPPEELNLVCFCGLDADFLGDTHSHTVLPNGIKGFGN